jgi:hypothetical protein
MIKIFELISILIFWLCAFKLGYEFGIEKATSILAMIAAFYFYFTCAYSKYNK